MTSVCIRDRKGEDTDTLKRRACGDALETEVTQPPAKESQGPPEAGRDRERSSPVTDRKDMALLIP